MTIYFSSDYHLGHENIIKYCNRPFKDAEEMDTAIIKNHNSIVKKEDTLFHIGDFCWHGKFEEYRKRLHGNIIFIAGNHEDLNNSYPYIESLYIYLQGMHIHLVHNPEEYDVTMLNLCGHIHQLWVINKFKLYTKFVEIINVGVDRWDFKPITMFDIVNLHNKTVRKLDKNIKSYTE